MELAHVNIHLLVLWFLLLFTMFGLGIFFAKSDELPVMIFGIFLVGMASSLVVLGFFGFLGLLPILINSVVLSFTLKNKGNCNVV